MNMCFNSAEIHRQNYFNLKNYPCFSDCSKNSLLHTSHFKNSPPVMPLNLTKDTVSFGAMKKNQFDNIDLVVVNKFKVPIEKFNSNEEFQDWCFDAADDKYKANNYAGRHNSVTLAREYILKEWFDYCSMKYNPVISLLITAGITSKLKTTNDTLPPVLHKDVLNETLNEIGEKSEENRNFQVNFNKLYQQKLLQHYSSELSDKNYTGWIVIQGKNTRPERFEDNVPKLKILSGNNWCTKSYMAENYLSKGDFHIYMENGKTKLGIRFIDDVIQEIQGVQNNNHIPVMYLDTIKEHTKNYKLNNNLLRRLKNAENTKLKIENIKKHAKTPVEMLKSLKMLESCNKTDGSLILKFYSQPDKDFTWEDLGVNENELFKTVKEIKGNADFSESSLTHSGNLEKIDGNAIFTDSNITNLGKLKIIGNNASFYNSKITNLGELEEIWGDADLKSTKISNLGKLRYIGGKADFINSKITELGNLELIGANAYLGKIKNTGNLREVGGDAYFSSDLADLGKIYSVGGNVYLGSNIRNLGNLREVGGLIYLKNNNYITPEMLFERGFIAA